MHLRRCILSNRLRRRIYIRGLVNESGANSNRPGPSPLETQSVCLQAWTRELQWPSSRLSRGARDVSDSRPEPLAPSCIIPVASLIDSVQSSMKRISYSFHTEEQQQQQQEMVSQALGVKHVSESLMATHAERRINVDFDSTRLISPSGATVHSHMTEVTSVEAT